MGLKIFRRFCQLSVLALSLLTLACGGGGGESTARGSQASTSPVPPVTSASSSSSSSSVSSEAVSSAQVSSRPANVWLPPENLHSNDILATRVTLAWDEITTGNERAQYRITRNGSLVATVDTPFYTDTDLEPGSQYLYRVQSGYSNWSAYTRALTVRTAAYLTSEDTESSNSSESPTVIEPPRDWEAPTTPTGFRANNIKDTRIDLVWQASRDNQRVSVYEVHRNGQLVATISGHSLAYLDRNLSPDTRYIYTIRARDAAGNTSGFSGELVVHTTQVPDNSRVNLVWQHPKQRENGAYLTLQDIQGYELRYRPDSLSDYTVVSIPGNDTTSWQAPAQFATWDFEIAVYDNQGLYSEFVILQPQ